MRQTRGDNLNHLREQCGFLNVSGAAFDRGQRAEGKRLAIALRILFWDNGDRSFSLLGQLTDLSVMEFPDNSRWDPAAPEAFRHIPRAKVLQLGWAYDPNVPVEQDAPWVAFDQWWNGVVFQAGDPAGDGVQLTRREVIDHLAHKDGGAHVQPKLPAKYARLARASGMEPFWSVVRKTDSGIDEMETGPVDVSPYLAAVRQIAEEAFLAIAHTGLLEERWRGPDSMFGPR